jgi:hypothetical protein
MLTKNDNNKFVLKKIKVETYEDSVIEFEKIADFNWERDGQHVTWTITLHNDPVPTSKIGPGKLNANARWKPHQDTLHVKNLSTQITNHGKLDANARWKPHQNTTLKEKLSTGITNPGKLDADRWKPHQNTTLDKEKLSTDITNPDKLDSDARWKDQKQFPTLSNLGIEKPKQQGKPIDLLPMLKVTQQEPLIKKSIPQKPTSEKSTQEVPIIKEHVPVALEKQNKEGEQKKQDMLPKSIEIKMVATSPATMYQITNLWLRYHIAISLYKLNKNEHPNNHIKNFPLEKFPLIEYLRPVYAEMQSISEFVEQRVGLENFKQTLNEKLINIEEIVTRLSMQHANDLMSKGIGERCDYMGSLIKGNHFNNLGKYILCYNRQEENYFSFFEPYSNKLVRLKESWIKSLDLIDNGITVNVGDRRDENKFDLVYPSKERLEDWKTFTFNYLKVTNPLHDGEKENNQDSEIISTLKNDYSFTYFLNK